MNNFSKPTDSFLCIGSTSEYLLVHTLLPNNLSFLKNDKINKCIATAHTHKRVEGSAVVKSLLTVRKIRLGSIPLRGLAFVRSQAHRYFFMLKSPWTLKRAISGLFTSQSGKSSIITGILKIFKTVKIFTHFDQSSRKLYKLPSSLTFLSPSVGPPRMDLLRVLPSLFSLPLPPFRTFSGFPRSSNWARGGKG